MAVAAPLCTAGHCWRGGAFGHSSPVTTMALSSHPGTVPQHSHSLPLPAAPGYEAKDTHWKGWQGRAVPAGVSRGWGAGRASPPRPDTAIPASPPWLRRRRSGQGVQGE
ncbi:hypothetical protein E2C01_085829 [Portunus trituberculatus]|uniref:Uncharacterized protein n=1 Tax=Portunus trituberculatus TaxID=210409 RepID=A0A5B7J9X8_PORTR|nr:hypothetical protein [Portunus trituberculatus]